MTGPVTGPVTGIDQVDGLRQQLGITARGDGSTADPKIDDQLLRGAIALVHASGVLNLVTRWRHADHALRHPGGAPAKYGEQRDLIVLALMVTLLLEGTPTQVEELRRAIMNRLSETGLAMLGLPAGDKAGQVAVYSRIRRAWDRLTDTFDMAPGRLGKHRPTRAEVHATKAARDPKRCAVMAERARLVMTRLLEASVRLARPEDLATWHGNITLDATVAPARGGGHRTKKPHRPDDSMNPDIDAEYHANHDGSLTHGFDVHIALTAQNNPYETPGHPILAIAATIDQPSRRVGENAVACLASIVDRGWPVGLLTTDKGYYANCTAEQFHLPVMALGYGLVGEPKRRRGENPIRYTHAGANYIDGAWYSPAMPDDLVYAAVHYADGLIDDHTFTARCQARRDYLFRPKHGPGGKVFMCPAQGPGATLKCVHKNLWEPPVQRRDGRARQVARMAPDQPLPVCVNKASTSFPVDHPKVAKYAQALHYGSREHQDTYHLHRSTIEGFNGYAKDDKREALGATRNRRRRGMVNHLLVIAISLAVTNIRKIKAFEAQRNQKTPGPDRPTTGRRKPYDQHRPSGQWPPGQVPGSPAA